MSHLARAHFLVSQGRYDLAEQELRLSLAEDSQSSNAHELLALCLAEREQFDEAESEARAAVHLAPEAPSAFLVLAIVLRARRRFPEAQLAIEESLRLDPEQAHAFGILSQLWLAQDDWNKALEAADRGLAIDPENIECANLRAAALTKLGRRQEAGQTIQSTLQRAPDDSFTHSNQGWALLEAGDRTRAMEHFREALRLEPDNDWARAGIVEALKSKNLLYRLMLGYFLRMARLSSQARWVIIMVVFLLPGLLRGVALSNPALAPVLNLTGTLIILFAILTWLAYPMFNLMLLADKFGRHALSRDQRLGAVLIGGFLLSAIVLGLVGWALNDGLLLLATVNVAMISIPASAIMGCSAGWPRWAMLAATAALASLGLIPLVADLLIRADLLTDLKTIRSFLSYSGQPFILGWIGSQFLAMWLSRVVPRR